MKKILIEIKTLIIVLLFVFSYISNGNTFNNNIQNFSDIIKENANDTDVDYTFVYDSYLHAYYRNLTYNFGQNYQGSCGYVAAAMLFSYYDSYLSDRIIAENYDAVSVGTNYDIYSRFDSPGTQKDLIVLPSNPNYASYGETLSAQDYYNEVCEMADYSLHSKLITIGNELGYYNFNAEQGHYCSSSVIKIWNVIDAYLEDLEFTSDDYEIRGPSELSHANVRQFTIDKIKQNYPVLLSVNDEDSGHIVIAYDYDETTDSIYCHMGYDSSSTHVRPEDRGYTQYADALVIDWDITHEHTNNYVVRLNNGATQEELCYDNSLLSILRHTCYYDAGYEKNITRNHKVLCECGNYITEAHTFSNNKCIKCELEHEHSYNFTVYYDNIYHKSTCACGEYILNAHVVSIENRKKCIICNGNINNNYNLLSGNIEFISKNGSYKLPNGIIVLVPADIKTNI